MAADAPPPFALDADGVAVDVRAYKHLEYWDHRYKSEDTYDWVADIGDIDGALEELVTAIGAGRCVIL
jgi:hypothetical protein